MNTKRLPFAILNPVKTVPPTTLHVDLSREDLEEFLAEHDYLADVMVLDIETKGNQVYSLDSTVVGFGLSDKRGAGYWTAQHWPTFLALAYRYRPALIGHNISFDGAYAFRDGGDHLSWKYCTYGLYRHLASEGWKGQRWSLKAAQVELLGWESSNDVDLNKWLVENGYHTSHRKSLDGVKDTDAWFYVAEQDMWAKADKSHMHLAPASILGKYCALDCVSTYLLYTLVFKPALDEFHVYHDFHKDVFINHVEIMIEQQLSGFEIDVDGFKKYEKKLEQSIKETQAAFFELEQVRDIIKEYNDAIVSTHLDKEPPKYKKLNVPKEPDKYSKQGTVTKKWMKWKEKQEDLPPQDPSVRWLNWEQKRADLASTNHFNPGSNKQLAWLFYEKLKYPAVLFTKNDIPATSGKVMKAWGPAGANLITNSKMNKELGYVKGVLDYQRDGIIHPQFKVPGTLTGRLAGAGNLNVQQMPKSKDFLSLFKAREGHVWVDFDWTALEPSVLTELSRDPNMLRIYGPDATCPHVDDLCLHLSRNGIKWRIENDELVIDI